MNKNIAMPEGIAKLEKAKNGYPIPYFVAWVNGEPDFRLYDPAKLRIVVALRRCWICGLKQKWNEVAFIGGPHSAKNQAYSDGPGHYECMLYSVMVCPYLAIGKVERDPEMVGEPPSRFAIMDKPEVFGLLVAEGYKWLPKERLFIAQKTIRIEWYKDGLRVEKAPVG